jgi:outer membrane protein OmpA-like peptidoglycan-associated protein
MKRLSLLLVAAGLLVGCGPSRMPSDFNPNGSGSGFNNGGLDTRPPGFSAMAEAIRNGNIPPEAILTTVYFDFDRYTVDAKERAKLDAVAGRVKVTKVIVAGYTDHFGTEEYNLGLSDKRAQNVRDYLVKSGANQANTEVLALGSQQADKSAAGRQSAAKDRKAIVVDANYSGPISSGAAKPAAGAAPATRPASGNAPSPAPVTAL